MQGVTVVTSKKKTKTVYKAAGVPVSMKNPPSQKKKNRNKKKHTKNTNTNPILKKSLTVLVEVL